MRGGRWIAGLLGVVVAGSVLAGPLPARAAVLQIVDDDGPGEGLNDPTPVAPVGGNTGQTIGAQRAQVLARVASDWGARLVSSVPIEVGVHFDPLSCSGTSAVLGSSGPSTAMRDFAGAPRPGTWFVPAVANALAGRDLDPNVPDVVSTLSSALGRPGCGLAWYYGFDGAPPAGSIDLYAVALHEFAHGLGFVALFDPSSGQKLLGFDDAYLVSLRDASSGQLLRTMADGARAAACVKPEQLEWNGATVTAAGQSLQSGVGPSGRVRMYSPAALSRGSSVSHFSTALQPNDLMEPFYTGPARDLDLTAALLADVGWEASEALAGCVPSATTLCLRDGRFRVEIAWSDYVGQSGAGRVVPGGTDDSGLFYFFGSDNWEVLVKVLDGCAQNDRYWVFAAAATSLQYAITVTDTAAGTSRTYSNPLDVSSPAVTDIEAFATCP